MTKEAAKNITDTKAYREAAAIIGNLVGWGKITIEFKDGKIVMSRFEIDIKH